MNDANGNEVYCQLNGTITVPCLHSPSGLVRDRYDKRAAAVPTAT
jgi:hypothetical protein